MTNDLAALSEAATQGEWRVSLCSFDAYPFTIGAPATDGQYSHTIADVCRRDPAKANAAFIVALVNAYRSGDLVLIDREGMRERVKAALLKEEEANWNVTLGLDEDVSDLADAAIAAILGEG